MMDTSELVNRLDHDEAMQLQAVELERTLELLRSLDDADWSAQTDCPEWDVHHMYLHVLGACEAAASMKENLHQMRAAKRQQKAVGGPLEAGLSAVQVRERLDIGPAQLVERLAVVAPVAVRKRTRMPELVRRVKLKVDGPVVERWPLGYLVDTIYLRDLWMHRVDACRATGREMVVTPGHDGRIIGDVVDEWAERHGRPYHLFFSGPPGLGSLGASSTGADDGGSAEPEPIEIDAVEFCRTLAGRAEGSGLLTTIVPF
jgi:uncharacterized protein (TIGR03083 family)